MMGPYLPHEFNDEIYRYSIEKLSLFLECMKRHVELYDIGRLRRKYMRKLCSLLFGPEMDVETLKSSICKSVLFECVPNGQTY
jgi:hypothetical protein